MSAQSESAANAAPLHAADDKESAPTAVADPATEAGKDAEPSSDPGSRRRVVAALLAAATVAVGSFGIWALVAAQGLHVTAAADNVALVDRATTAALTRQITHAVETIFSYSYADTARTKVRAQRLLTGGAIRQYDQLFALVEQQAPKQKLVVTTRVTRIGVELLAGGRARLLVFANQQDTRAGTGQTSYGGAMFAVTAVDQRGAWKIENINTFTGGT